MPRFADPTDNQVAAAVALAQDVADEIASILLTHYPDRDTLDLLRSGTIDLATAAAINRAVATEMAAQGVEVLVQKADRAAFRRWMHDRPDTDANRRRWIDRGRLLRGADAWRLLGLPGQAATPVLEFGPAPGPGADRLLVAFDDEDGSAFDALAQALLAAGRADILDLAVRKLGAREGEDNADALQAELLAAAEGGAVGPSGWAGLVTIPVALPASDVPDAAAMGDSFRASVAHADTVELRFLPGWRNPDALADLSPCALRRVLQDLVAGAEPRDLPPGDTDDLAEHGFGLLLGVQIDWDIPIWDVIMAEGLPEADEGDASEPSLFDASFDAWRGAIYQEHPGCVPLAFVPPSDADAEIADFLEEAGRQTGGLEEIREFIATARREADTKEIVGRIGPADGGIELSLFTDQGRFLDSLSVPAERMPASAEETTQMIAALVRLVA